MDLETRHSLIARLSDHADSAAWQEFVELYQPLVFGIARRHGLQPSDANDLVQEVFAAVATSIGRFEADRSRGRFRSWLFRVARNQTLLHLRRLGRVPCSAT
ncbi:MAG: sigma-70 family RNA polymerase sigma factor, partial [Pirellulales bacterium]|nr:sigma-70 family RNA polymerase sigma factor [Pirellulales bacterium]